MSPARGPRAVRPLEGPRADAGAVVDHRLDLHGMTVEQASVAVERHLERCGAASLPVAHIIHGHGTGALRETVHKLLDRHPRVARRYAASGAEGGTGVTVAVLKGRSASPRGMTRADMERLSRPQALRRQ